MRRISSAVAMGLGTLLGLASLGAGSPTQDPPAGGVQAVEPVHASGPEDAYPALHVIGFTDLDFLTTDEANRPSTSGFFEGQFVLHLTSALSPRLSFFGELSLTARRDALQSGAAHGFSAEVERSILKYTHNDRVKLSVGRYHTPINYWNVAFHHGQWLQTTVARPEMIQFGGQFLPVHFVGVLAEGSLPARGWSVDYDVGLGNGRSTVISRAGDAADVNNNRAWTAGLGLKPDRPFGLQVGGALYGDLITLAAGNQHRERILSGYVAWTKETPEVLAEYARVRHRDLRTDRVSSSRAYYAQAAYRLPFAGKRWKPYVRWEDIDVDGRDEVFGALKDRKGILLGIRYDMSDLAALKVEYRRQRTAGQPYVNGFFPQVSFTF